MDEKQLVWFYGCAKDCQRRPTLSFDHHLPSGELAVPLKIWHHFRLAMSDLRPTCNSIGQFLFFITL